APITSFNLPGLSNPPSGAVDPSRINLDLQPGEVTTRNVSLTLPAEGAVQSADVFLLFDDTGSFAGTAPILISQFPTIIAQLKAALPNIHLGFGVGRFEEYGGFAGEAPEGRPFILGQPIYASAAPFFDQAIQAALDRTTPGGGGDGPETLLEALYQTT